MPRPIPLIPRTKPSLNDIKGFGIRTHNYHMRQLLTEYLDRLYSTLYEARCKVSDSVDRQRSQYFNIQHKAPRYSEIMVIPGAGGQDIIIEINVSGAYEIVLRDVLTMEDGKATAYIDNQDLILTTSQIPRLLIEGMIGKPLVEIAELPSHYHHGDRLNQAIIKKVFTRNKQIIIRTTLWSAPSFYADKMPKNPAVDMSQLDQ